MYVLRTSTASQTGDFESSGYVEFPHTSFQLHPGAAAANSELPPEIWYRIFDILFFLPGALETSAEQIESYSEDSEGITLHGLYDEVMACKLAVSRVCRAWRMATLPSLFSYVKIVNRHQACEIARLFARFKQEQSEDVYYGRWVRRLEVCAEDGFWESESIGALVDILSNTPNLQVYSDFFSLNICRSGDEIIRSLQKLCEEGRLRRIEWSGTIAYDGLAQLLQGTPSLQVLISRGMPQTPLNLPKLKTLILRTSKSIEIEDVETLHAPLLQNLIVHSHVLDSDHCSVASTLASYPELTRLRWLRSPVGEPIFGCTALEKLEVLTLDLGLRKGDPTQLDKLQIKHRTLTRLNLVHLPLVLSLFGRGGYVDDEPLVTDFLNTLLNMDNLPALKSIGIYIPRSYFSRVYGDDKEEEPMNYAYKRFWTSFLQHCASRGVAVEASVGTEAHFCGTWQPFRVGLLPRYLR